MTELSEIYTSEAIKVFAFSLIGIFVPIFLLQNGLSFTSLCILFVTYNAIRLLSEPFIGKLIARQGAKHVLALSFPVSFLFIMLLAVYPTYHPSVFLIGAAWAVADSMHWLAYQTAFSKVKKRKESGQEIGFINTLCTLVGSFGPLLGAIVATRYGLHALFVIAPVLLLLAMIPLYQTHEVVKATKLSYRGLFGRVKNDMVAHAGLSVDVIAGGTIWPLFLFFVVDDYIKVGAIISLSVIVSMVSFTVAGKLSDRLNKKKLIFVGSTGLAIVNVLRNLTATFWSALGVNMLGTVVGPLMSTSLFSIFYTHADNTRRIEYVVLLEMAGDAARLGVWLVLLALSTMLNPQLVFHASFIMAAVSLFAINVVTVRLRGAKA